MNSLFDKQTIIFTVDVEEWYQAAKFASIMETQSWAQRQSRVEQNTFALLDFLHDSNGTATFFTLGSLARQHAGLIKAIHNAGHEIASHGFGHQLISKQTGDQFKQDIRISKTLLEDIIQDTVLGYRAPNFSITDWAPEILKECGYAYDSSYYPFLFRKDYGKLVNPPTRLRLGVHEFSNHLLEFPLSMLNILEYSLPWSGGGYFRIIPYVLFKTGIKKILKDNRTFLFYIHPWEIDVHQPKVRGLSLQHRFRHYANLNGARKKLAKLSRDFRLCSIKEFLNNRFPFSSPEKGSLPIMKNVDFSRAFYDSGLAP